MMLPAVAQSRLTGVLLVLAAPLAALGQDAEWTLLADFDTVPRPWIAESGPAENVRVSADEAHGGRRSLAVSAILTNQGKNVRVTWQADVSDLRWSLDSQVRFQIKGSPLAQRPHGGVIFVEANGRVGGGDSHWLAEIPGETYADPEWHEYVTVPLRETMNPEWAPDANGRPDPERIVRLLCVAQQEAPPELNVPFTFYIDDVEASQVEVTPPRYREAEIETQSDHITPIWRGFRGRAREHPAAVTFADVTGWRVAQYGDCEARLLRSEEEPCYEDLRHQAKLVYHTPTGQGYFELVPPEPIPIPGPFNAACAWVYGNNWSWVPDPGTPPVSIWVRLVDAEGQRHRLDLGVVNFRFYGYLQKRLREHPLGDPRHIFWGGWTDGTVHLPAKLEAIEVRGGSNTEARTIYLESVAFYEDRMELPSFRPELIEDLPFPTTPDTILPPVASPTTISLSRRGDGFVFRVEGDERLHYRYTPRTGTLSDLTVRVEDRPGFTPCAGAGPVFILDGAEREPTAGEVARQCLGAEVKGDAVTTRWRLRVGDDEAEYRLTLRAQGKSLIADWRAVKGVATAFRLGRAEGLRQPKLIRVPYLSMYFGQGPAVLLEGDTFCSTLLDWYNTECSGLYAAASLEGHAALINGGSQYSPLTDGTRNLLGERQFINVSSRFEEVLPSIPNPPSTQAAVTRGNLYCHLGGTAPDRFDTWLAMWRQYRRYGIERVMVSHHEDAWTNGADVGQGGQEYTMCLEAAPEVGDERLIAYCRAMREMGYYIGLYENFTDYNPLGKSWDERNALRDSNGEMVRVWPPTYAIRPLKALEMALTYPREVARKFGCNNAYRDCHTAYPPWGQVDYQAGSPGAGKLSTSFRAWGALLRDGHRAYGGPVFSEGGHHWFSAGLVDGNYAQMGLPEGPSYPLLLDFDLRRLHPLEADISMTPGWGWGSSIYQALAATTAYGHIGFQPFGDLPLACRYYYLMQQLQSRYVMVPVKEILYHQRPVGTVGGPSGRDGVVAPGGADNTPDGPSYARDGRFLEVSDALKADAHQANQVLVRYTNGLELAVNYNAAGTWAVELGGRTFELTGYSWAAVQGDKFVEYCTEADGARIAWVDAPAYRFADAGGTWRDFGPLACDGAVVVRPEGDRLRVIPVAQMTRLAVEARRATRVEAFDAQDKPLGPVPATQEGARLAFDMVEGAEYYLVGR